MHYAGCPLAETLFNSVQPTTSQTKVIYVKEELTSVFYYKCKGKGKNGNDNVTNLFY